jgi:hypothetical protein
VVRKHGRILLERIDQDGTDPHEDDKLAEPDNVFRYQRTRNGGMRFTGRLDQEAATQLEALVTTIGKPTKDDPRDMPHRHGDAMAAIVHMAANTGEAPTEGGEKPHVTVTLDFNFLLEGIGEATLDDGSFLTPAAARRLACDADIIPMVLGSDSLPLDVGREHRLVTPKQRKALVARDKGCAFPGCDLPARWADAHHIRHWIDGGATDLQNLVLLCRRHHRLVHHSAWSIQMINGIPWFTPPPWVDPAQQPVRNILRQ